MAKKVVSLLIRLVVGFGILYILSLSFNLTDAIQLIFKSNIVFVSVGLLIIILLRIIVVFRWKIILNYQNFSVPIYELIKINYISTAIGQVLPGGIGGDLLRGYKLNQKYKQLSNTASSILLDRILGIGSMAITSLFGSIISDFMGLNFGTTLYIAVFCFFFIAGFYLVSRSNQSSFPVFSVKNDRINKLFEKLKKLINSVTDKTKIKKIFLSVSSISIGVQLLRCVIFYFLFLAFDQNVEFIYFLIAIPITLILAIIPISIAGLGVREGSLVFFFTAIGVPAETSIAVGILFHLLQIIVSLPGIIWWIFEKKVTATT